jgi:GDPmannose 4,6-dehydratase
MVKLVRGAIKIKYGLQDKIIMGNLEAKRDYGFALDYCKGIHMLMQYHTPDDWVIASGTNCTIKELAIKIFSKLGLNFEDYYVCDPIYFRANEVPELCGDSTKIRTVLGWKPEVSLDQLIDMMLEDAAKDYKPKRNVRL